MSIGSLQLSARPVPILPTGGHPPYFLIRLWVVEMVSTHQTYLTAGLVCHRRVYSRLALNGIFVEVLRCYLLRHTWSGVLRLSISEPSKSAASAGSATLQLSEAAGRFYAGQPIAAVVPTYSHHLGALRQRHTLARHFFTACNIHRAWKGYHRNE